MTDFLLDQLLIMNFGIKTGDRQSRDPRQHGLYLAPGHTKKKKGTTLSLLKTLKILIDQ